MVTPAPRDIFKAELHLRIVGVVDLLIELEHRNRWVLNHGALVVQGNYTTGNHVVLVVAKPIVCIIKVFLV